MADNNFRSYRSRDAGARDARLRANGDDPLAELARLIGQSDPASDYGRDATRRGLRSISLPGGLDWAADERYAQPSEPAEDDYDARRTSATRRRGTRPAPGLSSRRYRL